MEFDWKMSFENAQILPSSSVNNGMGWYYLFTSGHSSRLWEGGKCSCDYRYSPFPHPSLIPCGKKNTLELIMFSCNADILGGTAPWSLKNCVDLYQHVITLPSDDYNSPVCLTSTLV